jgi:iron-sulfur cluster assembly protein
MLALTENATNVIRQIVDRPELGDGAGLRIAGGQDQNQAFALSTAEAPAEGDVVVEEQGARVFLASEAAELLDEKVLDAQVDDDGGVQFLLAPA